MAVAASGQLVVLLRSNRNGEMAAKMFAILLPACSAMRQSGQKADAYPALA
jgi:hypothetical protein